MDLRGRTAVFTPARTRRLALFAGVAIASIPTLAEPPEVLAGGGAAASQRSVYVFPIPGGRVALPSTQITFRGVNIGQLGAIHVSGSQSGRHRGSVQGDSDGQGGSFIPNSPFTSGETVTVKTSLNIVGAHGGTFQFTVATPAGRDPFSPRYTAPRVRGDIERFRSRPDLAPAAVSIVRSSTHTARGDLFLGPQNSPIQDGPMIRDWMGGLIWFKAIPRNELVADFRVQRYHGRPVLTWWQGYLKNGIGSGENIINDDHYRQIAKFTASNGMRSDQHEFLLTGRSTALITAYHPVYVDERPAGGPASASVLDSVVQEIDVPTGLVLFQWDSLDHVSVGDSHQHPWRDVNKPWDYFHINSIQQTGDGNLIISSRNTWAAYKISHRTGALIWTLGGKRSNFRMGSGTQFAYQHDARLRGHNLITIFDDGGGPPQVHSQSRVLGLTVDFRHRSVSLAFQYAHSPGLLAYFEGNVQQLGGNYFTGWGQQPYFSEYDSSGQMIFDGRFVGDLYHYRSYRFRWSTTPLTRPKLAAYTSGGTTTVYASWNGATGLAAYWRVLAGSSPGALRTVVKKTPRRSFEDAITIGSASYVAVQALDYRGRRLSQQSSPVRSH